MERKANVRLSFKKIRESMCSVSGRKQCDVPILFKFEESNQLDTQYFYGYVTVEFHACVQELERTFAKEGTT